MRKKSTSTLNSIYYRMDMIYRHSVSYHILISYIEAKLKHCDLEAEGGNS